MDKKIAFITGASKGIGEAISIAFADAGLRVALAARNETDLQRVTNEIRARGGEAMYAVCDVTKQDSVIAAVEKVKREWGAITILVNNAGQAGSHKFIGHDDALWFRMLDANLNSVYYVTKAIAPMMVEAKWGRIITIASIASKTGVKYAAAYTASKHAVLGLTRTLAAEFVAHNITVNAICPGYVDTPMTNGSIANMISRTKMSEADARAWLAKQNPQNRLIDAREVAHLALMLISDDARGITGQAINVDGGAIMY
ncbi:MAG: SDR family oxidoreductase [Chloroflexi bacterium]|nr:SDR family oxidoreductase [Chloroflexota bacterium]